MKFYYEKKTARNETKRNFKTLQNEISFRNISNFLDCHLSASSCSYGISCDGGKWPLGEFNAATV